MEEWRDVPGCEGFYQVSNLGQIRSVGDSRFNKNGVRRSFRGKVLVQAIHPKTGYSQVGFSVRGRQFTKMVHTIVALAFIGERPEGYDICHSDGDKQNNRVDNLRYDTRSSNLMDEVRRGTNHHASKTHCKYGHPFEGDNVRVRQKPNGLFQRNCRACQKLWKKIAYAQVRDGRLNPQEQAVIEELRRERESDMIASASNN